MCVFRQKFPFLPKKHYTDRILITMGKITLGNLASIIPESACEVLLILVCARRFHEMNSCDIWKPALIMHRGTLVTAALKAEKSLKMYYFRTFEEFETDL